MWKNVGKLLQSFAFVCFWCSAASTIVVALTMAISLGGSLPIGIIISIIATLIIAAFLIMVQYVIALFFVGIGKIVEASEKQLENKNHDL